MIGGLRSAHILFGCPGPRADCRYTNRAPTGQCGISVPAVSILNLGSAAVDVTITWPTAFPDANYTVTPQVATSNATLIGKITATVKWKTNAAAIITVTTTALLALGQVTLSAVAIRKNT
ncbi:gp53-like domain-containing protein [Microbacterium proteolyticum]|uniref:gp53-like domain-containing protein n=1 Tax=Microbacterium proteolyticum TaxID=1572644 RepID=UPI00404589D2